MKENMKERTGQSNKPCTSYILSFDPLYMSTRNIRWLSLAMWKSPIVVFKLSRSKRTWQPLRCVAPPIGFIHARVGGVGGVLN